MLAASYKLAQKRSAYLYLSSQHTWILCNQPVFVKAKRCFSCRKFVIQTDRGGVARGIRTRRRRAEVFCADFSCTEPWVNYNVTQTQSETHTRTRTHCASKPRRAATRIWVKLPKFLASIVYYKIGTEISPCPPHFGCDYMFWRVLLWLARLWSLHMPALVSQ